MKYSITIADVPGQDMWFSDTLSRSRYDEEHKPKPNESLSRDVEIHVNMIRENLPVSESKWKEIVDNTIDDETSEVKHYIRNSWPECIGECSAGARDYFNYRDELSVLEGVLIKGNRIVIPTIMMHNILGRLHVCHLGIEEIRRLARSAAFRPRINKEIADMSKSCDTCQKFQSRHIPELLMPHQIPTHPWENIATDFFSYQGQHYLVVIDHYSFYPEVVSVTSTSANNAITFLKSLFARHGIPKTLRTDNMPFGSKELYQFSREWEFEYPKSNGLAEKGVQVIKKLIKKCMDSNQDINLALLAFRSSPNEQGLSPAQLLFGRQILSKLPVLGQSLS